jgi:NADPH-dependent 2,4-dienoyl-CoA reductase/sulfur reductase-like enzyme
MDEPVDVAIVGGGPAGLGAAIALRAHGVRQVLLLEREEEAGGIPRQCAHPPYGIREFGRLMTGPTFARKLRERAVADGVIIAVRHSVTALLPDGRLAVATPEGAREIVAKRVILATGARETPRSARLLSGTRPLGVMNTATVQDCIYLKGIRPFERPVIIGTELVALSALLTCIRHGVRPAAMIEGDPRPVARWPLGLFPRLVGVPLLTDSRIAEIIGGERVEAVLVETPDGPRSIACDGVILSGSFLPEASLVRASHLALDPATGGPSVDQHGRCSDPAYFAAGNMLRAVETAGWCHREGLTIGRAVAADLAADSSPERPTIRAEAGSGVAWVMPQRLATPMTQPVHLRANAPGRGHLTVRENGLLLWSRRIATRRERRLSIPADAFRRVSGDITIAIEP